MTFESYLIVTQYQVRQMIHALNVTKAAYIKLFTVKINFLLLVSVV